MTSKYNKVIKYIHSKKQSQNGLCNFLGALNDISNPQDHLKIIHITGTNGKGSTCQFINSVLVKKHKVGLFSSPSIIEFTDRIKVNNKNISKEKFVELFEKFLSIIKKYNLSFFEIYTLISLVYFKEQKVDYAIYEVGVGGLIDPTNIVKPRVCGITNVGSDHSNFLGDTLNQRRDKKLGIQKPKIKLFIQEEFDGNVLFNYAKANSKEPENIYLSKLDSCFNILTKYQRLNASLAFNICQELGFNSDVIKKNIINSSLLPCRFEKIGNVILDGAHNVDGIKALLESLDKNVKYTFIFSSLKNKDYKNIIKLLKNHGKTYITDFYFEIKETINAKEIAKETNSLFLYDLELLLKTKKNIVITGSLYFLSSIRQKVKRIYNK